MSQCESWETVREWLCVLRLEQYAEAFQSAGLVTLQQCRNLTADQLERVGVTLPGHQRRILASLNKTHGNGDPHSQHIQSEGGQRLAETGHSKVLPLLKRPVPNPMEEKAVLTEREKKDGETLKPTPREREKPVPRERVSRMKEESEDRGEKGPVPRQRQTEPRGGNEEERDGGISGEKEKPVPKERTKFRPSAPADCHPSQLVSSTFDMSLPPVPPRSTPNCPPHCFTYPLTHPCRSPASPILDRHALSAQGRSVSQSYNTSSTPTCTPTSSALHSLNSPPSQTHPQTLTLQPPAQHSGSDNGRKTSPISPIPSPSVERNVPPLPPKVGALSKGAPPVPQRVPAQSPTLHR